MHATVVTVDSEISCSYLDPEHVAIYRISRDQSLDSFENRSRILAPLRVKGTDDTSNHAHHSSS